LLERLENAVNHLRGIAQLQEAPVRVNPHCQWFDLCALERQIHLFLHLGKIVLRRNGQLYQTDIIVAGDNFSAGAGRQHPLDPGRPLLGLVTAAQE